MNFILKIVNLINNVRNISLKEKLEKNSSGKRRKTNNVYKNSSFQWFLACFSLREASIIKNIKNNNNNWKKKKEKN